MDYKKAGVDIEAGDRFVNYIKTFADVGDFSARFKIGKKNILTTCDGVGTKILVAKQLNKYDTIGIDLVAMCVNDLLASGAIPISFMDYIACGQITESLDDVMKGIIRGCGTAECKLVGGETAEMPGLYKKEDFDLAGFAVGIEERRWPNKKAVKRGDALVGIPSSGIHSNGLSLARKVLPKKEWSDLLVPTKIYTREMNYLLKRKFIYGAAHITGGGFENINRVLPDGMSYKLYYNWPIPNVFYRISEKAKTSYEEMSNVFNLGIGMVAIASRKKAKKLQFPTIGEVV